MFCEDQNGRSRTLNRSESRRLFLRRAAYTAGGIAVTYSMSGLPSVAAWAANAPVVETAYGKVRGFLNDGICSIPGHPVWSFDGREKPLHAASKAGAMGGCRGMRRATVTARRKPIRRHEAWICRKAKSGKIA